MCDTVVCLAETGSGMQSVGHCPWFGREGTIGVSTDENINSVVNNAGCGW